MFLETQWPQTKSFYLKRFVRIMPAYWLALLILWKINAVNIPNASGLLRNISLLHPLTGPNVFTGIRQAWTLSIEMMFYACLPWIAAVIRYRIRNMVPQKALRNILGCLLALYISAYVFRLVFHHFQLKHFETHAIWFPAHIDSFALGMSIATVITFLEAFPHLNTRRAQLVQISPIFFLISGATWFWSTQIGWGVFPNTPPFYTDLLGYFLYGISAVTFVLPFCLDQGSSRIVKIFGSRICVWLGTISYGMYLWHYLFLDGHFAVAHMPYQIGDMGIAARLLVTIPGSIAIASVSYYLVERPLIRTVNQALHKRKNSTNRPDPRTA